MLWRGQCCYHSDCSVFEPVFSCLHISLSKMEEGNLNRPWEQMRRTQEGSTSCESAVCRVENRTSGLCCWLFLRKEPEAASSVPYSVGECCPREVRVRKREVRQGWRGADTGCGYHCTDHSFATKTQLLAQAHGVSPEEPRGATTFQNRC